MSEPISITQAAVMSVPKHVRQIYFVNFSRRFAEYIKHHGLVEELMQSNKFGCVNGHFHYGSFSRLGEGYQCLTCLNRNARLPIAFKGNDWRAIMIGLRQFETP